MDITAVALLEEARLAAGLREISAHVLELSSGGVACRGEPGAWNNMAAGLGMRGPVERREIDEIVAWYRDAGIEPRIELCPLADASVRTHCDELGFGLRQFENVLYRLLPPDEVIRPAQAPAREVRVRVVDPSDDGDVRVCARISMTGFTPPGHVCSDADVALSVRMLTHPRVRGFVASVEEDGRWVDVSAGALELNGEVGALFALSTLHAYRGLGAQQVLIAARLNLARERGVKVVTIGSRPGAGTERNVRRMGFQTAYTKAVLALRGDGLVPARG